MIQKSLIFKKKENKQKKKNMIELYYKKLIYKRKWKKEK